MLSYFYLDNFQNLLKEYIKNLKFSDDKYYLEKECTLFYPIIGANYTKYKVLFHQN